MSDDEKPTRETTEATRLTRLDDWDVSPEAMTYVPGQPSPLEQKLQKEIERDPSQPTDADPGGRRSHS